MRRDPHATRPEGNHDSLLAEPAHQQRTRERMAAHALILVREDITFLNDTHPPATSGLGPIGGGQRGLVLHSTLAFTPQGLPLGLHLARMGVVTWRLFWLTHIHRQTPAAPCTTMLAEHEWKALSTTIHRSPTIPAVAPSVRQAVRRIAQLGGFLGLLATVNPALPRSGADGHG